MTDLTLDDVTITGREAVPVTESVRLHGPPGTGKTTQSAARVATLIEEHGYNLNDIAWATYRKSLASDTLDRLADWGVIDEDHTDSDMSKGATRYIGTFHALGLRTYGDMGQPAGAWDRHDFCDERGVRYWSSERYAEGPGEKLFSLFDWLKNNLMDPENPDHVREYPRFDDLSDRWTAEAVANMWTEWKGYRVNHDLCDFYQMLEKPLNERRIPPRDVVVIDEFHDATPLMASLAREWIEAADIAIVAGDPHQVINGFDGASPAFFNDLDLPRVLLDRSYRVPHEHLALAFSVLSDSHAPPDVSPEGRGMIREYKSPSITPGSGDTWGVPDPDTPASPPQIARKHPGSTLFLARTRMMVGGIAYALDRAGIPYISLSGESDWSEGSQRLELYNALASLAPFDAISAEATGGGGLSKYGSHDDGPDPEAHRVGGRAIGRLLDTIPPEYIAADDERLREAKKEWSLESTGDPTVASLTPLVTPEFWSTWTSGAAAVDRLAGALDHPDRMALENVLWTHGDPIDPTEIDVRALTIHASKGMEADDVVVYDGITPTIQQGIRRSDETAANEARTWYVATTRANKRLHIMRDAFAFASPYLPRNLNTAVDNFMAEVAD